MESLPEPISGAEQAVFGSPAGPSSMVFWLLGGLGFLVFALLVTLAIVLGLRDPTPTVVVAPPPAAPRIPAASSPPVSVNPENVALAPAPPATRIALKPAAPVAPPPPPPPHAALALVHPRNPIPNPNAVTETEIDAAIKRGMTYLYSQFAGTRLKNADDTDPETFAGRNALAVYAFAQVGKATGDPRVGPASEQLRGLLDRLKEYPMNGHAATYSRSLRLNAMAVYNRLEDREIMNADLQWLLKASMGGAYSYEMPPAGRKHDENAWDNSNSQYGALGVWAAADAGLQIPAGYWTDVQQHWISCQQSSGGWGYNSSPQRSTLSMTAAGLNMLLVSRDQLAVGGATVSANFPFTKAMNRAIEWFDEGDNSVMIDGAHRGYSVYSLERAGLASGFKYFGTHDWYLEVARDLVHQQAPDGSWGGGDSTIVDTSFDLLFLSRGRQPVLAAKLRFDGDWNNRPRDLMAFSRFASSQLERQMNWQIADLDRNLWDWIDAPLLLISSATPPNFTDGQVKRLREYAQSGGLIFLHPEKEGDDADRAAADLAKRLFPEYPYEQIPTTHEVYSAVVPMETRPELRGISNGARLMFVYSPADITRLWQAKPTKSNRTNNDLGLNLAIYSAGRRDLRNRLDSLFIPPPPVPPLTMIPLAQLQYEGNWNPEPGAWERVNRQMQNNTGLGIDAMPTLIEMLTYDRFPIAHLTGTAKVDFSTGQIETLHRFVSAGGVLLIDACGGSTAFADAVQNNLIPGLVDAGKPPAPLTPTHTLLRGIDEGMRPIPALTPRDSLAGGNSTPLIFQAGKGLVLFTRMDLTSGLVGANAISIRGYQPQVSQQLVQNLLVWLPSHIAEGIRLNP